MVRIPLTLAALGLFAAPTYAQPQPVLTLDPSTGQPVQTEPAKKPARDPIYDENADAKQQIAAALAKAKKENRRVLVQWGANWCHWCHLLHDKFKDPRVSRELMYEYDVVLIDIGQWHRNMDLAASYGADLKGSGVPYLTVLDASGKAIANQETSSLELKGADGKSLGGDDAGHDAAKVLAFLKEHEAAHLQADAVVRDAMDQAKASGKMVFLHFGAPWCGWCHRLEDWLASDAVASTFAKDYVDLKVDEDRMIGAKGVEEHFSKPEKSGIPWFAIVDPATGKTLADSTGPKGNIGFPSADEEIQHFMTMLERTHKNLSAADLETLKESLVQEQKKKPGH